MAGAVVAAGLAVVSLVLPNHPVVVPISAELSHTGSTRVTFAKPLGDTTSPACGCLRHDPPGGWQGIVMPARTLSFERRGGTGGPTQYDIFSPDPGQWSHVPWRHGAELHVSEMWLPSRLEPTLRRVLTWLSLAPVQRELTDLLSLTSSGPLRVASLGREPVAALGVPGGMDARIDHVPSAEHPRDPSLVVTAGFGHEGDGDSTDAMPLLDVLGPKVVMWAPTEPKLSYAVAVSTSPVRTYAPAEGSILPTEFEIQTAQSARPPPGMVSYTIVVIEKGAFAARIAPRPGSFDTWATADPVDPSGGRMRVTVPRAASRARKLVPVFRRADADPKTWIGNIPFIASDQTVGARYFGMQENDLYDRQRQEFELPPTPPENGVNIFGAISELSFPHARGDFTLGTRPVSLRAKTPVELRDFRGLRDEDERRLLVPVRVGARSATLDVQGHADTRFNGTPVATERAWLERVLTPDLVALMCVVAGAFFAALSYREARRRI